MEPAQVRGSTLTQTREEHIARHVVLHKHLDELVGDFLLHTRRLPSKTMLLEFMAWSCAQTKNPTELPGTLRLIGLPEPEDT